MRLAVVPHLSGPWFGLALGVLLPQGLAAQPIGLHPSNPHYFLFRGQPTVLITSAEHYGAVINLDFDYKRYLRTLAADRLNLTRVFSGTYREGPTAFGITGNTLAPAHHRYIAPWPRTRVPGAVDGLGKFDLDQWNDDYFARLKDFLREADRWGVVVEFTLFCPYYRDEMWELSPLNAKNNVNGIGNYGRTEVFLGKDPDMQRVMDSLVRKIVAELRAFDNVMFEICNEPYSYKLVPDAWERHIAGVIAEAEADLPPHRRHLITQNIANGAKKIEAPDPRVSVFNFHYVRLTEAVALNWDLNRPIGCNETGFDGQADSTYRVQGWDLILAGGALYNNLDYSFTVGHEDGSFANPPDQPGGGSATLRRQLRILRDFMDSLDFVRMQPAPELLRGKSPADTRVRILAEPGKQYAMYVNHAQMRKQGRGSRYYVVPSPRGVRLEIDLPAGDYLLQWWDTKTGQSSAPEPFQHKGGPRAFSSPRYSEDIAAKIWVP